MKNILLTGGSGKLGSRIVKSGLVNSLLYPKKEELDITIPKSLRSYFRRNKIDGVINCAALSKMFTCQKDPILAISTNLIGTSNLVRSVLYCERKEKRKIRFVHISSDGVYAGAKGYYKESDPTIPYNNYGWTKLGAESAVNLLSNHCVIRTRFYDPSNIPFETAATDLYTSGLPINTLVNAIFKILYSNFVGTVNIGGQRMSDYHRYTKTKPGIKPCSRHDIIKNLPMPLASDASMNCSLWNRIENES